MPHSKIYFEMKGDHVHTEWFTASKANMQHGCNGVLIFRLREWTELQPVFQKFPEVFELMKREK